MNEQAYVLDTNILSAVLRRDEGVTRRLADLLASNARVFLCPAVFYEVYRGLLYRSAPKQLSWLVEFAEALSYDEFEREDWETAADRWATLRRRGQTVQDMDILIAVYARRRDAVVVTRNTAHFLPLDAPVEDWTAGG